MTEAFDKGTYRRVDVIVDAVTGDIVVGASIVGVGVVIAFGEAFGKELDDLLSGPGSAASVSGVRCFRLSDYLHASVLVEVTWLQGLSEVICGDLLGGNKGSQGNDARNKRSEMHRNERGCQM